MQSWQSQNFSMKPDSQPTTIEAAGAAGAPAQIVRIGADGPPLPFHAFAAAVGVSDVTARKWRREGLIDVEYVGRRPHVTPAAIRRFNARLETGDLGPDGAGEAAGATAEVFSEEPPLRWHAFVNALGVSKVTAWRWRKAGFIDVVYLQGTPYVTRAALRKFYARFQAGELELHRKAEVVA